MADKLMAYLKSQPEIWNDVFVRRADITAQFADMYTKKQYKNILVIGSGSSYNAACCVADMYAEMLDVFVVPCVPTRADAVLKQYKPEDTAVILISQSGGSTSTIAVMETVKKAGFYTIALTQNPVSVIAKGADMLIRLECGDELVGPKTKGFTTTVLTLQIMAMAICKDSAKVKEAETALKAAVSNADEIISDSIAWTNENSRLLRCAEHMLIVGEGNNRNALREGCLKVLECLYIPCMDYEFEEYMHGIHYSIGQGSHLVFVVPNNHNRERMLRLARFNEAHGGVSYIISLDKPVGIKGELFLKTTDNAYSACYDVLMPFQVISGLISADKGINCDVPKFPTFAHEMNTKNF